MALDYGRWPKSNGTKLMPWGVAPGYDEYRRWRKNHGHNIWPPNPTNKPNWPTAIVKLDPRKKPGGEKTGARGQPSVAYFVSAILYSICVPTCVMTMLRAFGGPKTEGRSLRGAWRLCVRGTAREFVRLHCCGHFLSPRWGEMSEFGVFRWRRGACHRLFSDSPPG